MKYTFKQFIDACTEGAGKALAVYDGDVFHASLNDADIVRRQSAEFRKFFSGIAGFDSCGANISSKPQRGLGALDFCQFM